MSSADCINICRICYLAVLRHERDDATIALGGGLLEELEEEEEKHVYSRYPMMTRHSGMMVICLGDLYSKDVCV